MKLLCVGWTPGNLAAHKKITPGKSDPAAKPGAPVQPEYISLQSQAPSD